MNPTTETEYDVIIIGAGHAGLSVSYNLAQHNIRHIVLERGRIGQTWRTQRWDSFALNTPNALSVLPGDDYSGDNPDGFSSVAEFIGSLETYAEKFNLPVQQQTNVLSVEKDSSLFSVTIMENGVKRQLRSSGVVVASGCMNEKKVPSFAKEIPETIVQLHTCNYKNPGQIPGGAVLVVGSAQSGCQIAEELLQAGKRVFLASSLVARVPRRYRGKDIFEWLTLMRFTEMPADKVPDPRMLSMTQPQISGIGPLGHTVSLQSLARSGATILGRLENADSTMLSFQLNAAQHVHFADEFSLTVKKMIDDFIATSDMDAPQNEYDEADQPDINASCASDIASLDLKKEGIGTIIWTTGFSADFSWIRLPVLDKQGSPQHKNGISDVEGLYFIGFPWLRTRKSGIIYGIRDDAKFITEELMGRLGTTVMP
ncbi:MAG: NAD(P)-binding domain-containing protein [Ignavibacteriales bacterium]|nr:NAD(P)-binding domain-containing protein [Ignavibacteriales bacterium]